MGKCSIKYTAQKYARVVVCQTQVFEGPNRWRGKSRAEVLGTHLKIVEIRFVDLIGFIAINSMSSAMFYKSFIGFKFVSRLIFVICRCSSPFGFPQSGEKQGVKSDRMSSHTVSICRSDPKHHRCS